MNSKLKENLYASGKRSQYDDHIKLLLSNKRILAYILINTLEEYQDMEIDDVISLIDQRFAKTAPVGPGLTNRDKITDEEKIVGINTEDAVINEGLARFDVLFYAAKANESDHMIIDIEAQKELPTHYPIYKRACYYTGRMISSQEGREFLHSRYGNIKNVASIWILMNMNGNGISKFHPLLDEHLGIDVDLGYDKELASTIFIYISKEIPSCKEDKLCRFLGVLLSPKLDYQEKMNIIENEYPEVVDQNVREEMITMCNLGEEREAIGFAKGEASGNEKTMISFILQMNEDHEPLEKMMRYTRKFEKEIKEIISKYGNKNN